MTNRSTFVLGLSGLIALFAFGCSSDDATNNAAGGSSGAGGAAGAGGLVAGGAGAGGATAGAGGATAGAGGSTAGAGGATAGAGGSTAGAGGSTAGAGGSSGSGGAAGKGGSSGSGGSTAGAGGASGSDGGTAGAGGAKPDAGGPTCGAAPARYTLLTGANDGLVKDNTTNLTWMRVAYVGTNPEPPLGLEAKTYCTGRSMRLPTKDEALAISGAAFASCAFSPWGTWTSTVGEQGASYWFTVDYLGGAYEQLNNNYPNAVLCVK